MRLTPERRISVMSVSSSFGPDDDAAAALADALKLRRRGCFAVDLDREDLAWGRPRIEVVGVQPIDVQTVQENRWGAQISRDATHENAAASGLERVGIDDGIAIGKHGIRCEADPQSADAGEKVSGAMRILPGDVLRRQIDPAAAMPPFLEAALTAILQARGPDPNGVQDRAHSREADAHRRRAVDHVHAPVLRVVPDRLDLERACPSGQPIDGPLAFGIGSDWRGTSN